MKVGLEVHSENMVLIKSPKPSAIPLYRSLNNEKCMPFQAKTRNKFKSTSWGTVDIAAFMLTGLIPPK
jgi:hypothetical protein